MYILYMYYVSEKINQKRKRKTKMINEKSKLKMKITNEKLKLKKGKLIPLDFLWYRVIIATLIYLYLSFVPLLFVLPLLRLHK